MNILRQFFNTLKTFGERTFISKSTRKKKTFFNTIQNGFRVAILIYKKETRIKYDISR